MAKVSKLPKKSFATPISACTQSMATREESNLQNELADWQAFGLDPSYVVHMGQPPVLLFPRSLEPTKSKSSFSKSHLLASTIKQHCGDAALKSEHLPAEATKKL